MSTRESSAILTPKSDEYSPTATAADCHDITGLATALTYAVARERGEMTHRLMAEDLDISPLAAEIILQALRPVVHEHYDIEGTGASINKLDVDNGDTVDDA